MTPPLPSLECEAEVAEGLESLGWRELKTRFGERVERSRSAARAGAIRFRYIGNPYQLLSLRTVQAVYSVQTYPVPRPKALLGDQHFKALLAQIAAACDLAPPDAYRTLRISAAGSDSSVMTRLKTELAARAGLTVDEHEGDLLIRLRRAADGTDGWETLVRLSPRPLAARGWRVCNYEGALNAPVAHAMALFSQPTPDDTVLNLMSGSGTLLIERLLAGPAQLAAGYDIDPAAVECAQRNAEAAGLSEKARFRQGDARDLPLTSRSIDVLLADLPFGQLVGSHQENVLLYPAVIKEAARLLKPTGRALFITHEVRLMEQILRESSGWKTDQVIRIGLGGMHPRIWILSKV
jgi:SAM-dependent methyltransferase